MASEFMFCTARTRLIKGGINLKLDGLKLNTDGSSLGNLGLTSRGGLIRDHNGAWIKDFT